MSSIRVPTPLRPYTEGNKEIAISADTVGGVLQQLTDQYPGLRQHLYDDEGQLRAYVNVFLNKEDVRNLDGPETAVTDNDELTIVPSIAGGVSRS